MAFRRYVFDTNVLVSAVLLPKSAAQAAFDYALDSGYLLVSEATLEELKEVLSRPKFERYQSLSQRMYFYKEFVKSVQIVEILERVTECRDPKDNKFLEVAINGQADTIISGDKDLLVLHPFRGAQIVSVSDFLINVRRL